MVLLKTMADLQFHSLPLLRSKVSNGIYFFFLVRMIIQTILAQLLTWWHSAVFHQMCTLIFGLSYFLVLSLYVCTYAGCDL